MESESSNLKRYAYVDRIAALLILVIQQSKQSVNTNPVMFMHDDKPVNAITGAQREWGGGTYV